MACHRALSARSVPLFLVGSRDDVGARALSNGKGRPFAEAAQKIPRLIRSALTCLEPALRLVDYVDAALAAHNAAVAVPVLERTKRVTNLHGPLLCRGA